jgi:hypothetical protein
VRKWLDADGDVWDEDDEGLFRLVIGYSRPGTSRENVEKVAGPLRLVHRFSPRNNQAHCSFDVFFPPGHQCGKSRDHPVHIWRESGVQ